MCTVCKVWYHHECIGISFKSIEEEKEYIFTCPGHKKEVENVTYRFKVLQNDLAEVKVLEDEISMAQARRKVSGMANAKSLTGPSYVEHEGVVYHISRFLSLQCGKAYCPSASRSERWKSGNSTNFFDKLGEVMVDEGLESGDFCTYVSVTSKTEEEYSLGQIQRIMKKVGIQSTFAVLSYDTEQNDKGKHSIIIKKCKLQPDRSLKQEHVYEQVPITHVLHKITKSGVYSDEDERATKQMKKKFKPTLRGNGGIEGMTVVMLKNVLDSKNIKYKKSARKPELIALVEKAI